MLIVFLVAAAALAGVIMISSAVAAAVGSLSKSDVLSLTSGTIAVPLLIGAAIGYRFATEQVDDLSAERLLTSAFVNLAIVIPIGFLASQTTVRFLARRAVLKGR